MAWGRLLGGALLVCAPWALINCGGEKTRGGDNGSSTSQLEVKSLAKSAVQELRALGLATRSAPVSQRLTPPTHSAEPLLLDTGNGGLSVAAHPLIREEQTGEIDVAQQQGGLTHLKLGDVSWVIGGLAQGAEDYLRVPAPESSVSSLEDSQVVVRYRLDLKGVAGLRLVGGVLEFLDEEGTPQWRVRAPLAVDAAKTKWPLSVGLENCHADTNVAPPWRRPVTAPGSDSCVLTLGFSAQAKFPVWVDPEWTLTREMAEARRNFGLVYDFESQVQVMGGIGVGGVALQSTEIYDQDTATWSSGSPLPGPRGENHVVSVAGGPLYLFGGAARVDRWQPSTSTWQDTGATQNTVGCGITLSANGKAYPVFVGGSDTSATQTRVEYQRDEGGWQEAQQDASIPFREAALCIPLSTAGGGILLFGGREADGTQPTSTWVLRPDPSLSPGEQLARVAWTPGPDIAKSYPNGVAFAAYESGWVLGGEADGQALDTTSYLDQTGFDLRLLEGRNLVEPLSRVSVISVLHDQLWVAGGIGSDGFPSWQVQYSQAADWNSGPALQIPRAGAGLVALVPKPYEGNDAGLLIIGGDGGGEPLRSVELLGGALGTTCNTGTDCRSGFCAQGVCCNEACDGECRTCVWESGFDGTCHDVAAYQPSPQGCEPNVAEPCSVSRLCDGHGACLPVPSGGDCGSTCGLGLLHRKVCDGNGQCVASELHCTGNCDGRSCITGCLSGGKCPELSHCVEGECIPDAPCYDCGLYACNETTDTCRTSCVTSSQCGPDAACDRETGTCFQSYRSVGDIPFEHGCFCGCSVSTDSRRSPLILAASLVVLIRLRRRRRGARRRS